MKFLLDNWVILGVGLLTLLAWKLLSRPWGIPPGPRGWPVIGNLFQLSSNFHLDFTKISQTYGDIFSLYLGNKLLIVLNNRQIIKEAFVTMDPTFADRHKPVVLTKDIAGYVAQSGALLSEPYGEKFARDKKFAVMAMRFAGYGSKSSESQMLSVIDEVGDYLMKQNQESINIIHPLHKGTAKIICSILFNKHHSWDDPELEALIDQVKLILQLFNTVVIADTLPGWLVAPICGKNLKLLNEASHIISDNYCRKRIEEHRSTFDPTNLRDFVDYYMKGRDGEVVLDDKDLEGHCLSFFTDSIDTIGYNVLWNIFFLSKSPEWQTRLQREIDEVIGSSRQPCLADKTNLPLTQAFLLEALRVGSIATYSMPHKAIKDTNLCGYNIPQEAQIIANFWAVNYNPKLWPEPETFQPDRHIDRDGAFIKTDSVLIFGQGRRMCMGEQLAKAESFMFLVRLLQRFSFKFPDNEPEPDIKDAEEGLLRRPPKFKVCAIPR